MPQKQRCALSMLREEYLPVLMSFAVRKGSGWKEKLDPMSGSPTVKYNKIKNKHYCEIVFHICEVNIIYFATLQNLEAARARNHQQNNFWRTYQWLQVFKSGKKRTHWTRSLKNERFLCSVFHILGRWVRLSHLTKAYISGKWCYSNGLHDIIAENQIIN